MEKETFIKIVLLHPEEAERLITTPGLLLPVAAISISCCALILLNSVRQLQLPSFTSDAAQLCSPEFPALHLSCDRLTGDHLEWCPDKQMGGIIISCSCSCSAGGIKCSDSRWNLRDKNKERKKERKNVVLAKWNINIESSVYPSAEVS